MGCIACWQTISLSIAVPIFWIDSDDAIYFVHFCLDILIMTNLLCVTEGVLQMNISLKYLNTTKLNCEQCNMSWWSVIREVCYVCRHLELDKNMQKMSFKIAGIHYLNMLLDFHHILNSCSIAKISHVAWQCCNMHSIITCYGE